MHLQNLSWISPNYLVYSFLVADKKQERGKHFNLLPCVLNASNHVSTLNQLFIIAQPLFAFDLCIKP